MLPLPTGPAGLPSLPVAFVAWWLLCCFGRPIEASIDGPGRPVR